MIRFKKDDGLDYPDWKQFKLKEIAVYKKGFAFKAKDYKKEGVKIIRVSDLGYDYIKKAGQVCLSLDKKDEFLDWELKENDIIITTVGSKPPVYSSLVGKVIKVTKEFDGCLLNQNAIRVRTREGYSQKFLYYVFSKKRYISFLESIMRGNANQGNITVEDLFDYEMFIPAIQEQEKIADFLSSIDDVIQIQEEKIVALEEQKKGVMQKLFNREVRFKADDGSTYPEWKEKKLLNIGAIITGTTPSTKNKEYYSDKYLWVTPADIEGKEILNTQKKLSEDGLKKGRIIPANSVLVTCIASIGKNTILRELGSCNQQINAITPNKEYNVDFVYYLVCFNENILHTNAGHGGMEILNKDQFSKLSMHFPCLEEQQKIADCLSTYDEAIQIKRDKLKVWKEIKKGLLQQMFV